jgi:hypothetical protein
MLCIKNREDRENGSQGWQMREHAVIPIAAVKKKQRVLIQVGMRKQMVIFL